MATTDTTARLDFDSFPAMDVDKLANTLDIERLRAQQSSDGTILPEAPEGAQLLPLDGAGLPTITFRGDASADWAELEIHETLGEGGMGRVVLARQLSLGREVAVKTVREDERSSRAVLGLLREAWVIGSLEHPSIVPVYSVGLDRQGLPLVVMKRIQGRRWSELLADPVATRSLAAGRERLATHLGVLMRVCDAVQFAHSRGIIHRDLKPDNIMIGEFGEVYVLDWGIAVGLDPTDGRIPSAKESRGICGTPAYMAPEMMLGHGGWLSTRTDVYLLGAVLHEIITGAPPHRGLGLAEMLFNAHRSEPPAFESDVPDELAAICRQALARAPEDRFDGIEPLRRALAEFLDHRSSLQLTEAALQRLAELSGRVSSLTDPPSESPASAEGSGSAANPGDETQGAAIHRLFGETRFAFREALRIWPENARSSDGLDETLATMAAYEIHSEHVAAASSYLGDCREPPAELTAKLEALEQTLAQRNSEVEHLRAFHEDRKLTVSSATRWRGSLVSMVAWVSFGGGATVLNELGTYTVSVRDFFVLSIVFGVLSMASVWYLRRKLWTSVANRRLVYSLLVADLVAVACWGAGWILAVPLHVAVTFTFLALAGLTALSALNRDRRLVPASLGYVITGVGSIFLPHLAYLLIALGNIALFGYNAWVWRGDVAVEG